MSKLSQTDYFIDSQTNLIVKTADAVHPRQTATVDFPRETQFDSYATFILTTAPNQLLCEIHNRMPVILAPDQEALWLVTEPANTRSLLESLRTLAQEEMECYPVSRQVNWAKNDTPELIEKRP